MTPLRRFLELSAGRRWLLTGTAFLTIGISFFIRVLSFDAVSKPIKYIPRRNRSAMAVEDIGWATDIAARLVPGTNCLTSSLVAHALCRRHGYPSQLYVGVDRTASEFGAHSWVESQGTVVVGDDVDLNRFETLGAVA